jgi:tRNA modification GTPase
LRNRIEQLRGALVKIMSSIYARIDYPDEDLGDYTDDELLASLKEVRGGLGTLASTYRTGRAVSQGVSTVICGKPNAGKSSLYNLLVGEDAAIVTDLEGTTRDVLERSVPLGRVMLKLCDTAGIRDDDSADAVERIGIAKSRDLLKKCDLLFALFDNSRPFDENDHVLLEEISESSAV